MKYAYGARGQLFFHCLRDVFGTSVAALNDLPNWPINPNTARYQSRINRLPVNIQNVLGGHWVELYRFLLLFGSPCTNSVINNIMGRESRYDCSALASSNGERAAPNRACPPVDRMRLLMTKPCAILKCERPLWAWVAIEDLQSIYMRSHRMLSVRLVGSPDREVFRLRSRLVQRPF